MKSESLRVVCEWLREIEKMLEAGEFDAAAQELKSMREDLITLALELQ